MVVLVETEAWPNTVANRKEQSGLCGTASGGADEAVQQMNRSIDTSPVNGYGSSVVKVKNLKGEEEDMRKILSIFIAVCLVLSLFTGIFVSLPSAKAANLGVWVQISLKMLVYPELEAQVHCLAADPITPSILYADTGEGVFRSTNSGVTWKQASTGLPTFGVLCLAINPKTPTTLYAGTLMDRVFRSTNSGFTWTAVNTGFTATSAPCIAINPGKTSTVYIGTNGYGIFRSTNGGNSWLPANTGLPNDYPQEIRSITADPLTAATLYVSNSIGRLFRSVDSGDHWVEIGNNSPGVNAFAINPVTPTTLYAGTTNGVFLSIDGVGVYSVENAPAAWAVGVDTSVL